MQQAATKTQVIIMALRKISGPSMYVEYIMKAAFDYQTLADQEKLIAEINLDYQDNPRLVTELLGDDIIELLELKTPQTVC